MDRLPVLVVGGDERNLKPAMEYIEPTQVPSNGRIQPGICPGARAVIVLSRWISHPLFNAARQEAVSRGIPLVLVKSGNYIVPQLVRFGLVTGGTQPVEVEEEAPVEAETSIGMSKKGMAQSYLEPSKEFIQGHLNPGEMVPEDDLAAIMGEALGVSTKDASALLGPLGQAGFLRKVGGFWRRCDKSKVGRQSERLDEALEIAFEVPGVQTKKELSERLSRLSVNGKPVSRTFRSTIILRMIRKGLVQDMEDGRICVGPPPVEEPPQLEVPPPVDEAARSKDVLAGDLKTLEAPACEVLIGLFSKERWDAFARQEAKSVFQDLHERVPLSTHEWNALAYRRLARLCVTLRELFVQ